MSSLNSVLSLLTENGIPHCQDVPLSKRTTFEIGGNAALIIEPETISDCKIALKILNKTQNPFFVLGRGSNLLCSDNGYEKIIISTKNLKNIELLDDNIIKCQSGVYLSKLCDFALEHSLSGLEFAFGIPGSVGGAIFMNAGAYGGEIKDVLSSCEYIDKSFKTITKPNSDLHFSYRQSFFKGVDAIITCGYFKLKKGDKVEIKNTMSDIINKRKEKQPLNFPSAGSTFKRPKNGYASALIDQCGLKGKSVGGAKVSEKHAGFIINAGGATCADVIELTQLIQKTVLSKKGIELIPEIKILK